MSYTYNPTVTSYENIRLLLADQVSTGELTAARYEGHEPIDILLSKVSINNYQRAGSGYPTDNITLSGTITAATGDFADINVSGDASFSGTSLTIGGRIYNYPSGLTSQTYVPTVRVVTGNTTAKIEEELHVIGTATITDPTSPVQGFGYRVFLHSGTVTVGGVSYTDVGSLLYRIYHDGSWTTSHFKPHGN